MSKGQLLTRTNSFALRKHPTETGVLATLPS